MFGIIIGLLIGGIMAFLGFHIAIIAITGLVIGLTVGLTKQWLNKETVD